MELAALLISEKGVFVMLSIQKPYLLEKTTRLSALEIGAEGKIETPEGMLLTMTVDGVQMDALPGSYQGILY